MNRLREFHERLWAGEADAENAARRAFQADLVERALRRLGAVRGRTVVEIGPGAGTEAAWLAAAGARTIAIDFAHAALNRTRQAGAGGVWAVQAAAEALPLAASSIDGIFAQTVLMHLDLGAAAAEWARVLRPGGRVVILEPLAGHPLVALYRRFLSPYRAAAPRYITISRLASASAAFHLVCHEEHYLLSVLALALPVRLRGMVRTLLEPIDRALLCLPGAGRLAWMTLAELERR